MSDCLKILVVSPTPTWPLDHGNRKRVHQVCSALAARGHEIHFVLYPSEHDWLDQFPLAAWSEMRRQWTSVHLVIPTRPSQPPPVGRLHDLDEWWDPAVGETISWLSRMNRFDAVLVNYVWLSKSFEFTPTGILKVLDTHDRVGSRRELLARQGLSPEFFYTSDADEIRGLARADLVFAIKEQEGSYYRKACPQSTTVMTLPYAEPRQLDLIQTNRGSQIRFGSLSASNPLNRASTEALIAALAHCSPSMVPPFQLLIGGGLAADLASSTEPFVDVMGPIETPSDFYKRCDCVVVPLTNSTGQKVRVGEALAFGLPIIAHAHAFEGYHATHRLHQLSSIEAVAAAMLEVAETPSLLDELAQASLSSGTAQFAQVDVALSVLEDQAAARSTRTLFRASDISGGSSAVRFICALRVAARAGRAVLWLDGPPDPELLCACSGEWPQALIVVAPPSVLDTLPAPLGRCETLPVATLEECISIVRPDQAWLAPGRAIPSGVPIVLVDTDLDHAGTARSDLPLDVVTIGSRESTTAVRPGIYSPYFLGQQHTLWRTRQAGRTIWIASAPGQSETASAVARWLDQQLPCRISIWCEGVNAEPPPWPRLDRSALRDKLDRPDLGIVLEPAAQVDPLVLELLGRAAAPCVVMDRRHASAFRRRGYEVADLAGLFEWLELVVKAWEMEIESICFGATLPVPGFDLTAAIRTFDR